MQLLTLPLDMILKYSLRIEQPVYHSDQPVYGTLWPFLDQFPLILEPSAHFGADCVDELPCFCALAVE